MAGFSKGAPVSGAGMPGNGCSWHPFPNVLEFIMPADGTGAANVGTGDFGTSPIFGQLSDKPQLASIMWGVGRKEQWQCEKLPLGPIR
jgi:hypothetical protein